MTSEWRHQDVVSLASWLHHSGFTVDEKHQSESFGNQLEVFARGRCRVRIVRDRGQWFVDIEGPDQGDWFDVPTWQACFTDGGRTIDHSVPTDPVATFRQMLLDVEAELASQSGIGKCLRRRRAERARSRLGLPPLGV